MNILINSKMVKRYTRLGQILMFGGMAVLIAGMVINIRTPEMVNLSLGALLVGFLLSQVGIQLSNRWARQPRPYEAINKSLKGLDGRYTLYHYTTRASHLLVGPSGVWVIQPRYQGGTISYSNGRYHQKGGNLYLKIFGQDGIGRPDLEAQTEVAKVRSYLRKLLPEEKIPDVNAVLTFIHPKVTLVQPEGELPAYPFVTADKLKDVVRKASKGKGQTLSNSQINELRAAFENPEILGPVEKSEIPPEPGQIGEGEAEAGTETEKANG
jgi:hypothetical protein